MAFKSLAQMRKFQELVREGKMKQETFNQHMKESPLIHKLPERLGPKSISTNTPVASKKSAEDYKNEYKKRFGVK